MGGERSHRARPRVQRPDAAAALRDGSRGRDQRDPAGHHPTSCRLPRCAGVRAARRGERVSSGPGSVDGPDVGRSSALPPVPLERPTAAAGGGRGPPQALSARLRVVVAVLGDRRRRLLRDAGQRPAHRGRGHARRQPGSPPCRRRQRPDPRRLPGSRVRDRGHGRRDGRAPEDVRPGRAQRPLRQSTCAQCLPSARIRRPRPFRGAPRPSARFALAGLRGIVTPLLHPQGDRRPMTTASTSSAPDVTDLALAAEGVRRIEWAEREMPVLRLIRERFERDKPLDGLRIGACLHVTTETANLMRTLKAGGADVVLAASNPLSTKDDVAAALVAEYGIATFARRGEDNDTYYSHLRSVADTPPQLPMDDGCDLVNLLHTERPDQVAEIHAGTEETTTGVIRLRAMAADGMLRFPVIAVNEAQTKHLFDNRYGTGQSTLDGILRATNILIAGRRVVVAGYGWVGKGISARMAGHGAHVTVVEVDPVRALEALMDGFGVMTVGEAAAWGELFITATGNINVFRREHFEAMSDGAIMANSGHFDAELDLAALRAMAEGHVRDVRENVQEFDLGGKRLNLIAEGRLVNLGAAEGHPAAVMDMSFANQALSAEYVAIHHAELEPRVYVVPEAIDAEVARLKLAALGITLDAMTAEQAKYVASWQHGT